MRHGKRFHGTAAVMAMVCLVLFMAMSAAFYAVVNTSVAVARNDRNSSRAAAASESGMEFVKHCIGRVRISSRVSEADRAQKLYEGLTRLLAGSTDFPSGSIAISNAALGVRTISLPVTGTVAVNPANGHQFAATIRENIQSGFPLSFYVTIRGQESRTATPRAVSCIFVPRDVGAGVFQYAMATPGAIDISHGSIVASTTDQMSSVKIMSGSLNPDAPTMTLDKATIGGQIAVTVSPEQVLLSGENQTSIDGSTSLSDIQNGIRLIDPPVFPEFDTAAFRPYATNTYSGDGTEKDAVWTNIYIPAGKTVSLTGNTTINGILYVAPGATLSFGGNVNVNGVIVCEQVPVGVTNAGGTITMSGNYNFTQTTSGMSPALANLSQGYALLAPSSVISISGSAGFTANGSIVCDRFVADSSSGSGGAKDTIINNGTLLALSDSVSPPALDIKNRRLVFNRDTNYMMPTAGVAYAKQYVMDAATYMEILP